MKKTDEIKLRDKLELIVDSQGKKEVLIEAITNEFGPKIPECINNAMSEAQSTNDWIKVASTLADFAQIPKAGDSGVVEGAKIATASIVAALKGIGEMVDT